MDCGCGTRAALPTIRSRLHGYLGARMGGIRGKGIIGRRETCMNKGVRIDILEY